MPYVDKEARIPYEAAMKLLLTLVRNAPPGELNYVITRITLAWLDSIRPLGYTELALAIGVLETARAELQRRCIDPYESGKAASNGDVGYELFNQEKDMHS